jgi:hypothetical protein
LQEGLFHCSLVNQSEDIYANWPKVLRVEEENQITITLVVAMLHDQIPIDD